MMMAAGGSIVAVRVSIVAGGDLLLKEGSTCVGCWMVY